MSTNHVNISFAPLFEGHFGHLKYKYVTCSANPTSLNYRITYNHVTGVHIFFFVLLPVLLETQVETAGAELVRAQLTFSSF